MKTSGNTVERAAVGWGVSARFAGPLGLLRTAAHGLPPGFRIEDRPVRGRLLKMGLSGRQIEVIAGGPPLLLGASRMALRSYVESWLESLASTRSSRFAFLHAGAVEIDGRAIVFPGRSCAGKSTLAAEFIKRGARYLTDDLVPVDRRLRAHPFPRPLGIRPSPGYVATRTPLKVLRGRPAVQACPIAMVWCGSYDSFAARATFKPRTAAEAFADLLQNAPGARVRPEVIVPILAHIARTVPVFAGRRGEASEFVDAAYRRLRRS